MNNILKDQIALREMYTNANLPADIRNRLMMDMKNNLQELTDIAIEATYLVKEKGEEYFPRLASLLRKSYFLPPRA